MSGDFIFECQKTAELWGWTGVTVPKIVEKPLVKSDLTSDIELGMSDLASRVTKYNDDTYYQETTIDSSNTVIDFSNLQSNINVNCTKSRHNLLTLSRDLGPYRFLHSYAQMLL